MKFHPPIGWCRATFCVGLISPTGIVPRGTKKPRLVGAGPSSFSVRVGEASSAAQVVSVRHLRESPVVALLNRIRTGRFGEARLALWSDQCPSGHGEIGVAKVVAHEQDRDLCLPGDGIGEAIAEIELRLRAPYLAVAGEGLDRDLGRLIVDRKDAYSRVSEECVNRIHRLYREEGLSVRKRRTRRKAVGTRAPILVEAKPNARWSTDFVHDQFANGRRFRILNIVDDVTKQCLGAIPDTSISGRRVARELTALIERHGKPGMIVSDHGTEYTCNAMLAWCRDNDVDWHFIAPGKPMQNGFVEMYGPPHPCKAFWS